MSENKNLNIDELNEQPELSEKDHFKMAISTVNAIVHHAFKKYNISKAPTIGISDEGLDELISAGATLDAVWQFSVNNLAEHAAKMEKSLPKGKVRDMKLQKKNK